MVVRYRSDLAISLNNLGVAYCRIKNSGEANNAFTCARELLGDLSRDYPDEPYYQTSLAAQLNNQALALAEMGQHSEALSIYRDAIAAQQKCCERAPGSQVMRELLSKMHYNLGQSLRAERRWRDAFDVAIARQKIWNGNGERLLGVAAEIAELDNAVKENPPATEENQYVTNAELSTGVLTTLQMAYDSGWPRIVNLTSEERFAPLRKIPFATKIAELNQRSLDSGALGFKDHNAPQAATN
jgi:hypothetical protein